MLRDKQVLIVLDNAASEEQVRPLLPGDGESRALVTSRRLLAGLEGLRRLNLNPLSLTEATEFLTGIRGERSAVNDGSALTELAQLCGGLPLALRIVGNRLVSRPEWNAAALAARLSSEERRLDQLSAGDLKIATAFGLSYDQLADSTRQVFRRLALVPGRDFDAELSAVLGENPIEESWDALDELVDLGLLQDSASGRYRFHDLVKLFARDRLQQEEAATERAAIVERMTSWLLQTTNTAGRRFQPAHDRPGRPEADLTAFSSADSADRWLRTNVDNWLGALRDTARRTEHRAVLDCAWSIRWFAGRWMHGSHWQEVFSLGATAAAALGDPAHQAAHLHYLARVYHAVPLPDPEIAMRYAVDVLDAATRSGATAQMAWGHSYVGQALLGLGRFDEGAASVSQSAEIFKADGDIDAYCQSIGVVGQCLWHGGHYREALDRFLEMSTLASNAESGMTPGIAAWTRPNALAFAGACLESLDRRDEAIDAFTKAADLFEKFPLSGSQARCVERLAALLAHEGRTEESRQAYARAAKVFEAISDAEASSRCHDLATVLR